MSKQLISENDDNYLTALITFQSPNLKMIKGKFKKKRWGNVVAYYDVIAKH